MDINSEVVPIVTTDERFFSEYLTLKKPLLEVILSKVNNKNVVLNPKLLQVFASLLYYNNKYRDMEENLKWDMVFNNGAKGEISKKLRINMKHLNTYLSMLRSLKLLNGKQINKPFIIYPEDNFELTFKFKIE